MSCVNWHPYSSSAVNVYVNVPAVGKGPIFILLFICVPVQVPTAGHGSGPGSVTTFDVGDWDGKVGEPAETVDHCKSTTSGVSDSKLP